MPKYDDTDTFELSLNGGPPRELVYVSSLDEYRHKIEGPFYRIKYDSPGNYWEVTDKTGVKMKFGSTVDSKIGRQTNLNPGVKNDTYCWYLDRIEDPNTNYMVLSYWRDQDTNNTFQVYLQEVRYNGNSTAGFLPNQKVTFNLETSYRSDKIYNYRGGFKMWTRKRLSSIEVWTGTDRVRRYQLGYAVNPVYNTRSQLTSVKLYGSDNTSYLVPTNFTYLNQWSNITEPLIWENPDPCSSYMRLRGGYGYADTIDLNGDVWPDRPTTYSDSPSCALSDNKWMVYFNNGDGFNNAVEWQNQGVLGGAEGNAIRVWDEIPIPYGRGSKTDLIDMNGDGRPDRVRYKTSCTPPYNTNCPWSVYLNNGSGFDSPPPISWTNPSAWGPINGNYIREYSHSDLGYSGFYTDVIDMNGDGLPDRVVYDKTSPYNTWTVYFNTGSGFGSGQDWSNPSGNGPIDGNYIRIENGCGIYADVIDMNGDGLPDRVVKKASGAWWVYFNTGSGFADGVSWAAQGSVPGDCIRVVDINGYSIANLIDVNGDGLPDRVYFGQVYYNTGSGFGPASYWPFLDSGTYATSAADQYGTHLDVFDIQGDGMPDQVIYDGNDSGLWAIYPNIGPLPDLLNKVENGIGGTIEFSYRPSTDYSNTYLPFVVQTVSSIKTNDGNGVISTTNYTYSGGSFSTTEREFRGFGYAKQTKPDQTTVETWFYQDDIKKGLAYDQITKDSQGHNYLRTQNTYTIYAPYTNVNFPALTRTDKYEYDTDSNPRQSAILFTYDVAYGDIYGNIIRKQNLGDLSISTDDKDENTQYFYNTTKWIVSLPTYKDIKDYAGTIKAKTWFDYDQDKGNLTQMVLWLVGDKTDLRNPVYNYGYDTYGYGNLTSITDPKGYTTTINYEDPINLTYTYPYRIRNPKNHDTFLTYDKKFGKLKTSTDPNTNMTTYTYDVFGRLTKITKPYDESSTYGTVTYDYLNFGTVGQQRIATLATEQSGTSNYLRKETYFDGLGRTFKTRQEGPGQPPTQKVIVTKTEYNTRGFVYRTSLPYFENQETPRWRTYLYDPMGRVTQITYPDSTHTNMTHVKGVKTLIDQNGHQKVEEKDVFERLVKVKEYTGTNPNFTLYATTNYAYSVLDNLENITDTLGNQTTMVYDPLSRKTEMTDPDMGHWYYDYDKNNNLTYQKDAKNQEIWFTYDELNRVTLKDYPSGVDIDYVYDEDWPPPYNNSKGRLTTVTDESGMTKHYYDKLGRITKAVKTVDSIDYAIETTYDPLDRTTSITYPDGQPPVSYIYDTAGNLASIPGYVTLYSNYNALGQPGTITYPNGVTTTKTYRSDNNRLQNITTSPSHQNLTYGYDNKGNITSISDGLDGNRSQTFGYDEIDRLTSALSPSYGTITYNYNEIGNMTYNSQVGYYTYGDGGCGIKAHAVTQAGSNNYTYDCNGNMETGVGRAITNNYDNKPSSITLSGVTTSFTYDYQGQRVKKIASGTPTIYIGKLYECTSGDCTKYILAGTTRIDLKPPAEAKDPQVSLRSISTAADSVAVKAGEKPELPFGPAGTNFIEDVYTKHTLEGEQRVSLKPSSPICGSNVLYFHTDHLGSSNVITNSTGGNAESIYYYPFGSTRVQSGGDCVNHKFTGQEEDSETGLYNYGARYYDPALGRFISPDSIVPNYANPQSLNRYSYALNNPLYYTDPTGQQEEGEGTSPGFPTSDNPSGDFFGFLDQYADSQGRETYTVCQNITPIYLLPEFREVPDPKFTRMLCHTVYSYQFMNAAPSIPLASTKGGRPSAIGPCTCAYEVTASKVCFDPNTGRSYTVSSVPQGIYSNFSALGAAGCYCVDPNGNPTFR